MSVEQFLAKWPAFSLQDGSRVERQLRFQVLGEVLQPVPVATLWIGAGGGGGTLTPAAADKPGDRDIGGEDGKRELRSLTKTCNGYSRQPFR